MKTIKISHNKNVRPSEVVFLRADVNYTELHFENGNKIVLAKTLKKLQESFSQQGFFRISKTFIINLKFLSNAMGNHTIVKMKNNVELNVSRRRREDLKDFLESHKNK
ncbi:LytR/AlgR family response regulator transcription factor [Emticicia sp. SJ17W-69]|uniref:LytR/AlgR family response regulator transcription factor n=1 Tax=Emticicia sp. SJ17W-69 TaxID=3421657 RepID=UPI003EB7E84D